MFCLAPPSLSRRYASVAQGIEHWFPVPGVAGSNPAGGALLFFEASAEQAFERIGGATSSVYAAIARLHDADVIRPLTDRVRNQVWVASTLADELDALGVADRCPHPEVMTPRQARSCPVGSAGRRTTHASSRIARCSSLSSSIPWASYGQPSSKASSTTAWASSSTSSR